MTLNQAGTFKFHCEVHPAAMKGVVTVTGEAAAAGPAQASAGPREIDVGAVDFAFEPKDASVAAGGKVTVTNKGQAPHTMTLDDVDLDTGNIDPGASAELTAPDAPGSYSYRCAVHPARMRGVLVVLGRDTEDPNAQAAAPPPPRPPRPPAAARALAAGVTAFVLATAVVAAFLGGIGVSAFALRRRAARPSGGRRTGPGRRGRSGPARRGGWCRPGRCRRRRWSPPPGRPTRRPGAAAGRR